MTFHTQVVGANGQRQAMFIERTPGLAEVILSNFAFGPTRRDDRLLGERPDGRAGRDGPRRPAARAAGDRGDVGRAVDVGRAQTRASAAACSTRPTSSSTCAPRTPTRWSRSTGSTRRSAQARRSPPSRSSTRSRCASPSCSSSAARCRRSSPGRRSSAPSARGSCSTTPIGSMRGASLASWLQKDDGQPVTRRRCNNESDSLGSPPRGQSVRRRDQSGTSCKRRRTNAQGIETQSTDRRPGGRRGTRGSLLRLGVVGRTERGGTSAAAPSAAAPSAAAPSGSAAAKQYTIGYSNAGGVGNGFREEQLCTAKAEALASGDVSKLTVIHRNTDAAGQLQDIRDLIAKGVERDRLQPERPDGAQPGPRRGAGRGHQDRRRSTRT